MAKRNDPVARARGRKPAPVKKPFPVAMAVGSTVLAVLLIGVLFYSAKNQGIGDTSSLKYADSQIGDLVKKSGLGRSHVATAPTYPDSATTPPVGGNHNEVPQSCQVYTAPVANQNAVHSLEHGAAWVTYDPAKVKGKDLDALKELVDGDPYRLLSPYPGLKKAVSVQAWGRQVMVDKVSDKRVKRFLELYTNGPQTLERGATCVGTTTTAGAVTNLGGTPTPAPTASGSASAAPSASASAAPSASAK